MTEEQACQCCGSAEELEYVEGAGYLCAGEEENSCRELVLMSGFLS